MSYNRHKLTALCTLIAILFITKQCSYVFKLFIGDIHTFTNRHKSICLCFVDFNAENQKYTIII